MKKLLLILIMFLTANMVFASDFTPISKSYYKKALTYYKAGNIKDAKEYFEKVVSIEPNYIDAYYNLGVIMENEQKYEGAIYYYKKAVSINPNDYEVKYRLGFCLNENEQYDEAINYLSSIPMNAPTYKSARSLLSKISPEGYPIKNQKTNPF